MDWRRKEDYDYTEKLPPEGWAWEFLRRNKKYREDYQHYLRILPKFEQKKAKKTIYNCNIYTQNPEAYIFTPPLKNNETIRQWHTRNISEEDPNKETPIPTMQHKSLFFGESWSLVGGIKNPDEIYDKNKIKFNLTFDDQVHNHMDKYFEYIDTDIVIQKTNKSGALAIGFDLSLPLKNQIISAEKYLIKRKEELEKHSGKEPGFNVSSKWETYLRILDARLENINYEEIGRVLYPPYYNDPDACEVSKAVQDANVARTLSKKYKNFIVKLSPHKIRNFTP